MASDASLRLKFTGDNSDALAKIAQLKQRATELQAIISKKTDAAGLLNTSDLKNYQTQLTAVSGELENLSQTKAFNSLTQGAESALNGVKSVYSSVRQLAYILPGIGVAGIFDLAIQGATYLVSELANLNKGFDTTALAEKRAADASKELQKSLADLKDSSAIIAEAVGGTAGTIDKVEALGNAILDTNKSYTERQNALEQLQRVNKSYFGDLTLEADSLAILKTRIDDYSQAIISEAVVKGFSDEIAKTTIEFTKQGKTLEGLQRTYETAQKALDDYKRSQTTQNYAQSAGDFSNQQAVLERAANNAKSALDNQRSALDILNKSINDYKSELNGAIDASLKFKPTTGGTNEKNTQDQNLRYLEETQKLIADLQKSSNEPLFKKFQQVDQSGIGKSVEESVEGGLAQVNFGIYQQKLKEATEAVSKGIITQSTFDQYVQALKDAFNKNADLNNIRTPINLSLPESQIDDTIETIKKRLNRTPGISALVKFDVDTADLYARVQTAADNINKILNETVQRGAFQILQTVGDVFASGSSGLQKGLRAIGTLLGDALIKIGEQLIIASGIIKTIKVAIDSLFENPVLGAVVGAAAIVAGAALKAALNKTGATAFADGGVVTGPTYGLIGEAGPEVIFPLNKLNDVMNRVGGQNVNLSGEFRVSGTDLVTVLSRANRYGGRIS